MFWSILIPICLGLLLVSISVGCFLCCKKKETRVELDAELRNFNLTSISHKNGGTSVPTDSEIDDSESEAEYIKITKPQAVRGKLDYQDYGEITDKALRTGKPFEDLMVK